MAKNQKKHQESLKIPKIILAAGSFLSLISNRLTVLFAARLFTTPLKHRIPKREHEMNQHSQQEKLWVNSLQKEVVVYRYGNAPRKILLVHGWSGRGTQLVKIADALLQAGYATVSFDAPAHGKSPGKTTLMPEFIASIFEIEKQYGPFEAAVGHSLGGMSLLNAVKDGFKIQKLVTIGSGDVVRDIIDDFVAKLELKPKYSGLLQKYFESKSNRKMDDYSSYKAAQKIEIPVLVIHDQDDADVPVHCAEHISEHLKKGELLMTQKLGHRKILGDTQVIEKVINFIQNEQT